ncbi:MAG TPA: hypothetical protein VOA41_20955 [Candidatus Dormibacteraeota bacterium]|nr:hypothetical protein [Candidatus Dormibacteraeota bacterium]
MKSLLRLFLSFLAGIVWGVITFFIPTGKPEGLFIYFFNTVHLPIPLVFQVLGMGFIFPAFLLGLPAALIVGWIYFSIDRTRPWMAGLAAALCEIGFIAVSFSVFYMLGHALY